MAAKGGGAWKVAYADFVTAMMAFFLVMWICGQDQKVRRAVSHYFQDPIGAKQRGNTKTPSSGSVFESINTGALPAGESVAMGQGRNSHSDSKERGGATKLVSDFLHSDRKASDYWREQALKHYESARSTREVRERLEPAEQVAARQLCRQLRDEVIKGIPSDGDSIYRELLSEAISAVNWLEIAEDLMSPRSLFRSADLGNTIE